MKHSRKNKSSRRRSSLPNGGARGCICMYLAGESVPNRTAAIGTKKFKRRRARAERRTIVVDENRQYY